MAAHANKMSRILPAGFSLFLEHTAYVRFLSGHQSPGKPRNEPLPGKRFRALLLAVILVAGFLPAVSGAKDHQINAGAGYGGSIQPSGLVTVQSGDTPLFSMIPSQGFRISSVVIDGSPVGAVPVYTFTPVRDDHMIYARFVRMTGSLSVASYPAGARVYLDYQYTGTIPHQGNLLIGDVAVGPHALRFILEGYETAQIEVTGDEGGQTVVPPVVLTPVDPPVTTVTTTAPTTTPTTIPTTGPTTAATTIPTGKAYGSLTEAKKAGAATINYGIFLNTVLDFIIVAFVIFLLVKQVNRMRAPAPAAAPTTKDCPFCVSSIAIKATRCPNCTSTL